jgi:hypothetical protein
MHSNSAFFYKRIYIIIIHFKSFPHFSKVNSNTVGDLILREEHEVEALEKRALKRVFLYKGNGVTR